MNNVFPLVLVICISLQNFLLANSENPVEQISDKITHEDIEPLFISLGSWCNVAINLRRQEMRKKAYPFDFIATVDCEKFLEIFLNDFRYFLDDEYLFIKDSHLFNEYYHIEFPHDFYSDPSSIDQFKKKYERRISRFREIENYKGKVYFIRSAFGESNNPQRYFRCVENISISDTYALRLFDVLKNYFPQIDFTLIICDIGLPSKKISENIIRLQEVPDLNVINVEFGTKYDSSFK